MCGVCTLYAGVSVRSCVNKRVKPFFGFLYFFAPPSKRKNPVPGERASNSRREYFRGRVHKRRTPTFNRSRSTCICCVTYCVRAYTAVVFGQYRRYNDKWPFQPAEDFLSFWRAAKRCRAIRIHCIIIVFCAPRKPDVSDPFLRGIYSSRTARWIYIHVPIHNTRAYVLLHCCVRTPDQEVTDRPTTTQNLTCYTCIRMRYVRVYDGTAVVALHNVKNILQYRTYTSFNIYNVRYPTYMYIIYCVRNNKYTGQTPSPRPTKNTLARREYTRWSDQISFDKIYDFRSCRHMLAVRLTQFLQWKRRTSWILVINVTRVLHLSVADIVYL